MSEIHKQSNSMKALEQSLNDHMEICSLKDKVKRLKAKAVKLKAEVERLDALCKQVMAQHSDISCENIMLRKAGDAMVGLLEHMDVIVDMDSDHPEVEAWLAAKEGKQP